MQSILIWVGYLNISQIRPHQNFSCNLFEILLCAFNVVSEGEKMRYWHVPNTVGKFRIFTIWGGRDAKKSFIQRISCASHQPKEGWAEPDRQETKEVQATEDLNAGKTLLSSFVVISLRVIIFLMPPQKITYFHRKFTTLDLPMSKIILHKFTLVDA